MDGLLNYWHHTVWRGCCAYYQKARPQCIDPGVLWERYIDRRADLTVHSGMSYITNYSDNGTPPCLLVSQLHAFADRIFTRPEPLCHHFIYDDNFGRLFGVLRGEFSPLY